MSCSDIKFTATTTNTDSDPNVYLLKFKNTITTAATTKTTTTKTTTVKWK